VKLNDLFVGASINVYARHLKVLAYGDAATEKKLSTVQARTLIVVKAHAYTKLGSIIDHISSNKLVISKLKMMRLSERDAVNIFGAQSDLQGFTSGNIVAMEVVGQNAEAAVASLQEAEGLLYVSSNGGEQCKQLLENPSIPSTAQFSNCSVCLIRPHAMHLGQAGAIIDSILSNSYEISAMQVFNLDRTAADEFLEVYKGVLPEYNALADGLTEGPSLALEIRGENVVQRFRNLCGPNDPEVARMIRPGSIRAEFGQDKVKNSVHCTDLEEDGVLESEYFFSILQQASAVQMQRELPITTFTGFR
jgi:nucleoside-diphosphate kinase